MWRHNLQQATFMAALLCICTKYSSSLVRLLPPPSLPCADVRVWSFNPPGGMATRNLSAALRGFVTSVVGPRTEFQTSRGP